MVHHYQEIDEVIAYIHSNLEGPLSLELLADFAGYSPYHFARIFKRRTGLPPHYYVSSYRLHKAKELLLHTDFCIRDIALDIGQQSLGTFTTRFTSKVGVTPAKYRHGAKEVTESLRSLKKLRQWETDIPALDSARRITGTIYTETPFYGVILVGLFARPIPEGLPLYGTLLDSPGTFDFTDVKAGTYYLMATAISWNTQAADIMLPDQTLRARASIPIHVDYHHITEPQYLTLHKPKIDDPPILISLPLLMNNFLHRVMQK